LKLNANRRRCGVLLTPSSARIAHLVEVLDHIIEHAAHAATAARLALEACPNILGVPTDEPPLLEPFAPCLRKSSGHGAAAEGGLPHGPVACPAADAPSPLLGEGAARTGSVTA